jgi:DNA polymerase elongation subunit (family B)
MFKNIYVDNKTKQVHIWECFNGKTVKLTEDLNSYFYVEDRSGATVHTDIYGTPVIKKYTRNKYMDVKKYKKLQLKICESDISEDIKYLQERYQDVDIKTDMNNIHTAYIDIEVAGEKEFPEPDLALYPINLITVKSSTTKKLYTFGTSPMTRKCLGVEKYAYIENELDMLTSFVTWWSNMKFDIVTGWNSTGFDMKYIINRIKNLTTNGIEKKLSPLGIVELVEKKTRKQDGKIEIKNVYKIAGLSQLDYLELYKKFTFETQPSYTLDNIGIAEVQEGKIGLEGTINTIYKTNWDKFVEYNIQDVLLVEKIDNKLKFIELVVSLCYQTLIPFEKVFSSISVLEGFILRDLHKRKMVMPDRKIITRDWWLEEGYYKVNGELQNVKTDDKKNKNNKTFEPFYIKGGYVYAEPGFYEDCLSFDVESEYPKEIVIYNISPETKVIKPSPERAKHLIKSEINGVYYKKDVQGIFPSIVERIFDERKYFKDLMSECEKKGDKQGEQFNYSMQLIRKIMINSLYGVMGSEYFHFYDVDNARAVTRGGRVLIKFLGAETNKYFKNYWHKVYTCYFPEIENPPQLKNDLVFVIDTDSNYINLNEIKKNYAPDMDYMEFATIMDEKVLEPFFVKILDIYHAKRGVKNLIRYKREGIITKQFVLAKKKYIVELLAHEDKVYDKPTIKYKGVEVVRSDTPMFSRKTIKDVIQELFDNLDKEMTIKTLRKSKKAFKTEDIENISSVSGINGYEKYSFPHEYYIEKGLVFKKSTPIHNRACICYNYLIKKYEYPYMEVANGSKIKYVYIKDENIINSNVIAYIGNYPKEFNQLFKIDYDTQFEKTFMNVIQRMFTVLGWGKINLRGNQLGKFLKKKK